jgi:transposase InsO family protein
MMVIDHPIYEQDEDVLKTWINSHRLKHIHGTWYKDGRCVVTGGLHDKRTIIRAHHDPPVYGHLGINRSIQLTSRHYWWPKIRQDVHDYVKGCADCQRNKINTHPIRAPLQPIYPKLEALPFETIALDFITKLPESEGSDSILTVVDHDCTKAAIFIPCREEITAEETAGLYVRHVFTRYGLPSRIISDRDPRFASKFTRELCHILGISQNISTAYHPRTNGQSEAKNKWVEQHLRFYINHYQKNWTYYLPMAEFAHNTWASETTRESPFTLLMGYNPHADWIDRPSPIPQVALRIQQFKEARECAQQSMIKAQKSWVKHKDTPKFQLGDLVWLEGKNLRTVQPTAKLAPKRHGPFKVTQVMSAVNYRLELPTQWSIHPVFHIDLLMLYCETPIHGANYQRPPPDLVEGEEEHEVETVLVSRRFGCGKKLQYLVKWKGYPDSDNQWINKEDVFADDAIREFKNSNPDQETHIRRVNVDSPYPHSPPPLLMQNNVTAPVTSTAVSDNWTIRDDSTASTSTTSSAPSQSTETTRSQYSFRVEDGGEPSSVELQLPTSMAEESTTAAESPRSVNSEFPITYYVHGQEAPIPFSLTNEAHIIIGSQENQMPITIPPPGNSPALRHIRVTPSSRDSPEVQTLVHAALNRIRDTASATPGGAFFEDNINNIEQVLSLARSIRDPRRGTASEDDATASLMSRLNQVRRPCSPTLVIRRSRTPVTYNIPQNTIPNSAALPTPVFSPPSRRGQLAPESDAPQRRRTHGQRGQGGTWVSVVQPILPVSGHVSRPAESVSDLMTRLTHPPPPLGFERNIRRNYVPCLISLEGGRQVPATYVRVVMSINPQVIGRRDGDEAEYGGPVYAQPDFGAEASRYAADDLGRFRANAPEVETFDEALTFIHDRVLIAEVYRFRQASMAVTQYQCNIEQIQEHMWEAGALMEGAARRLEGANTINRIEDAMDELRQLSRLNGSCRST